MNGGRKVKVIPSIDILDGKVVRLYQGDYQQVTIYYEHPYQAFEMLKEKGAKRIHIVDLNRAQGESTNVHVIKSLVKEFKKYFQFQVGGGIRSLIDVEKLLEMGVDKVVIGSLIFTDYVEYQKIIEKYGDKVILALDVKADMIRRNGWLVDTKMTIQELVKLDKIGRVYGILTTDIAVDGGLKGPNIQMMKTLAAMKETRWIASGGISSREDLIQLSKLNLYGAILGKSIFENLVSDLSDL